MADGEAESQTSLFLADVLEGLSRPQKAIPARWFYDEEGSRLFDQITELTEYYPTKTELGILASQSGRIAERIGPNALIVEYGAGSLVKVKHLLDALEAPAGFVPVDISGAHLEAAAKDLRAAYPELDVLPVTADFVRDTIDLTRAPRADVKVGFFPGSTVGNMSDEQIQAFLENARRGLGPDGLFIIGIDQPKSPDILIPAYDDAKGVTAAFNLNILVRANRELGADFDLTAFRHKALWNESDSRIEMHLVSLKKQTVHIDDTAFQFAEGETIHTENSRKIALSAFNAIAETSGWTLEQSWSDERGWFALALLS